MHAEFIIKSLEYTIFILLVGFVAVVIVLSCFHIKSNAVAQSC